MSNQTQHAYVRSASCVTIGDRSVIRDYSNEPSVSAKWLDEASRSNKIILIRNEAHQGGAQFVAHFVFDHQPLEEHLGKSAMSELSDCCLHVPTGELILSVFDGTNLEQTFNEQQSIRIEPGNYSVEVTSIRWPAGERLLHANEALPDDIKLLIRTWNITSLSLLIGALLLCIISVIIAFATGTGWAFGLAFVCSLLIPIQARIRVWLLSKPPYNRVKDVVRETENILPTAIVRLIRFPDDQQSESVRQLKCGWVFE